MHNSNSNTYIHSYIHTHIHTYIHRYIHTYIYQKKYIYIYIIFHATSYSIYPRHQHNLKENVDQRKTNLGWCCHLQHQPLSQAILLELSSCHSLDLPNLTLLLLPLNKL